MNGMRKYIAVALSLAYAAAAMAIPARPGVRTVTQPDGSTINIIVHGDEFFHYTTTEDGRLLQEDSDGFYRLATIADDGAIVATDIHPDAPEAADKALTAKDLKKVTARRNMRRQPTRASQYNYGLVETNYPVMGSPRALVILAEFKDVKFNKTEGYDPVDYHRDMINGDDFTQFGGTGSARRYFIEQSHWQFSPRFDVLGPVTLPRNMATYGANDRDGFDRNPHLMVIDAMDILDPTVDFSVYDTNGDGVIDNVYVFYAGLGEADFGGANTIWPHSWDVQEAGVTKKYDGKLLSHYACSNEWAKNKPEGVGTFIHEFSHVMGLPDLYNTVSSYAYYTPLEYSVLDLAPYNNDQRTPCNYSAFERNALGWAEPLVLREPCSVTLNDISQGGFALIPTGKNTEFFLLENRQQTGWDTYIPNHGLLIWHIDYDKDVFEENEVNNVEKHQLVDLVEANGEAGYYFQKDYTFPGTTGKTSFTSETTPALKTWAGLKIDVPITNITETDGVITFDVKGGGEMFTPTAVKEIIDEEDAEPEYYTMQGIRIAEPAPGTIVIERKGNSVRKLIFR